MKSSFRCKVNAAVAAAAALLQQLLLDLVTANAAVGVVTNRSNHNSVILVLNLAC